MKKKFVSELLVCIVAALIVFYITGVINYFSDIVSFASKRYPIFFGVMFCWIFAIMSTKIILLIADINHSKRDQYEKILISSEQLLIKVNIIVLCYISINLACEALTNEGVPIFSDTFEIVNFIQVSPQDAFLISVVFITIFLLFFVAPRYEISKSTIIIGLSLIIFGLLILFFIFAKPVPSYLFCWDEIPGNDNDKLIEFLKQKFGIDWVETAEIEKIDNGNTIKVSTEINHLSLNLNQEKTEVILKIDDNSTDKFIAKFENGKLNIYLANVVAHKEPFFASLIFGFILTFVLWLRKPNEAKVSDYSDLSVYFSIIPAPIVASLVLIGHKLVTYPNLPGHTVVGFLFISGFASLVILTMISLKNVKIGHWIWRFTAALSLLAISFFSLLFLFLEPFFSEIETFRNTLLFSIAIILLILQYGFSYEKLLKYRFTEWWRREWRPKAMVISILLILIVGAISPEYKPWEIPVKLLSVLLALVLVVRLPFILRLIPFWKTFWKNIEFRGFKLPKLPHILPEYQGIVLVKVETGPDKLKNVVNELDSINGVYQTMVVMGEYDVCLIVEGVDSDDIAEKIFEIRKIEGVASTTTLTDIRESFDRLVK